MRHYENLVIVKPTLTAEEIKSQLSTIEEIITSNGGEIVARNEMGMRKLAYPINKNERGFMYVMYFKMDPASIAEVERRYRINEELLRFVTIKYDSKREVTAWNKLVEQTMQKPEAKKEAAPVAEPATEVPEAETAPKVETAPEAPATEAAAE
ncbi:MAG: 30S ribosomal protein S6 [Sulfurimonas sp.]|nr:MAG: 30S ribosomal protein S6 [Sulfurimonas sp.]